MTKSTATLSAIRGGEEPTAEEVAARIERRLGDAQREISEAFAELEILARMAARPTQPAVQRRLLTAAEAAEVLGIGESTVHGLRLAGELASVKIGTARRFPVEAIDDYIARLSQKGA